MQVNGALQGVGTIPRRGRLNVLLAVLVLTVMVALLVWAALLATSGGGAKDASPKAAGAGSAVYYPLLQGKADIVYYPLPHGKVANAASSVNR